MVITTLILGATIFFWKDPVRFICRYRSTPCVFPEIRKYGSDYFKRNRRIIFLIFRAFYQFISFFQKRIERFCLIHFIRYLFAFGTNAESIQNGNQADHA